MPGRRAPLIGANRATVRDVLGNAVIGDVSGILIQTTITGPSPEPLSLPWRDPVPGTGILEIFNLLTWRSRLSETLVGRDDPSGRLLAWAKEDPRPIAIRLLSGPGGAGKSRLAAEVMDTLRKQGWSTGLIALDKTTTLPLSNGGLFIAIDYPEANREAVRDLLRGAGRLESPPCRIRLLLLSRQPMRWWQDDVIVARASELCDAQEVDLGPLSEDLTCALVRQVAWRLAALQSKSVPDLEDVAIAEWYSRDPNLHGLPLIATAAAVHAVLDPAPTFSLAGPSIIEALVARERMRLNTAASNAGWPHAEAGPRLHGLAGLRSGLDELSLKHLAQVAPDIGLPAPERVVDQVRALGWWSNGHVPAPQPDLVAAELLYHVLNDRPQAAPDWIAAALANSGAVEVDRLGRLMHDLATLRPGAPSRLSDWLTEALARNPERAETWRVILDSDLSTFRLAPLAAVIGRALLQDHELEDSERATTLRKLSTALTNAGDQEAALAASREAVGIHRHLAKGNPVRFEPDLAGSLEALSVALSDSGNHEGALTASYEAVEILRRLAQVKPVDFEPDLAKSLHTLSVELSDNEKRVDALEAIQQAVDIHLRLAHADPARFEPDLARSLQTLSIALSDVGKQEAAREAIRGAVELHRRLAQASPARFEPDLAKSLHNLSIDLSFSGDQAAARSVIREAVEIRRRLAQANPTRFEPDLARSLITSAAGLSATGNHAAALVPIREAVEIRRHLAKTNPDRFEADLAKSLITLAACLSETGDDAAARAAMREASDVYGKIGP